MPEEKRPHLFGDPYRAVPRLASEVYPFKENPSQKQFPIRKMAEEAMNTSTAQLTHTHNVPLPPNTLTNADGTPYSAGYDDALKEAALRKAVGAAIGICWADCSSGVLNNARATEICDALLKKIKEILAQ